jgi:hypothetical protein
LLGSGDLTSREDEDRDTEKVRDGRFHTNLRDDKRNAACYHWWRRKLQTLVRCDATTTTLASILLRYGFCFCLITLSHNR